MNIFKQMTKMICFAAVTLIFLWSCEDNKPDDFGRTDYNKNIPVKITGFEPDSGGLATKVFISGSNFGSDPSKIKVYLNSKNADGSIKSTRAPVVGSDGNHIYAITPRQPGRENTFSVVVHGDSASLESKKYLYRTMTTVTTIAGRKGMTDMKAGSMADATFPAPFYICIDDDDNIFAYIYNYNPNVRGVMMINQKKNYVEPLDMDRPVGVPTVDEYGKVILFPAESGDAYMYFDPETQWSSTLRIILHPTPEMQAAGMRDFSIQYKNCFATSKEDGYIWTLATNGQLIRFNSISRYGQLMDNLLGQGGLYFDPYQKHILYVVYYTLHTIYTYDTRTGEHVLFAGTPGTPGWKDGHRLEASFNAPRQMVIDTDGSLVIADHMNHCLRRITPDGMVSTVIGKGGVAGYQDGNPEDALFSQPQGLCIGKDGTIYVADTGNQVVRKLAVE